MTIQSSTGGQTLPSCSHHLPAATRWRGWVVACSMLIASAESQSTWGTLIGFSVRAEETSHFFLIKEEPADTPTCTQAEAETRLVAVRGEKILTRQPVPSAMRIRHRASDRSPITQDWSSARQSRSAAEEPDQRAPFSELKVRRVSSSALRNARTDCCKTSGKFLSNTYYAEQTCALL